MDYIWQGVGVRRGRIGVWLLRNVNRHHCRSAAHTCAVDEAQACRAWRDMPQWVSSGFLFHVPMGAWACGDEREMDRTRRHSRSEAGPTSDGSGRPQVPPIYLWACMAERGTGVR
jgi:hypothetical protein